MIEEIFRVSITGIIVSGLQHEAMQRLKRLTEATEDSAFFWISTDVFPSQAKSLTSSNSSTQRAFRDELKAAQPGRIILCLAIERATLLISDLS